INYQELSRKFADIIVNQGGDIKLKQTVKDIKKVEDRIKISTQNTQVNTRNLINCTGLMSDRITKLAGIHTNAKIVPFRGEYYELKPNKRHLVKNLIYPVPNPDFPLLGVHFTRTMNGKILVGPNAVPSIKREGYKKTSFNIKDTLDTISYPGFWRLASKYMGEGTKELYRSFNKKAFLKNVKQYIPAINEDDLIPAKAGVRAQALDEQGNLIDDFFIVKDKNMIHVCNAPSPAATASIEIGKEIVNRSQCNFSI